MEKGKQFFSGSNGKAWAYNSTKDESSYPGHHYEKGALSTVIFPNFR